MVCPMRLVQRLALTVLASLAAACASQPLVGPTPVGSAAAGGTDSPAPPPPVDTMTAEQCFDEQRAIFVLAAADQLPRWRAWAARNDSLELRGEALGQLALLGDAEGVRLAVLALREQRHELRAVAAQVLAHYGSPRADSARSALAEAVAAANDQDRGALVWALVTLGDKGMVGRALDLLRRGELATVQRLGGGKAFDPERLAALATPDELAKLAADPSSPVRQLVAKALSDDAAPKWTSVLVGLLHDPNPAVAAQAASGLARIPDEQARGPLREALRSASPDRRARLLQGLRDGIGGEGLVLALDTVAAAPEEMRWFQVKQLVDMLQWQPDPSAGDVLVRWLETAKPHPHWRAEAGIRLIEIGDLRGAKYVAERMAVEGRDIYAAEAFWQADEEGQLLAGDKQRIVGARMLADLTVMFPAEKAALAAMAGPSVMTWLASRPQPHANGMRFLAAAGYEPALPKLRQWAFPRAPLPAANAQPPFPEAFAGAQIALRHLGRTRDAKSYDQLLAQFDRKDGQLDISMDALMGAGRAMQGMALRAVAVGAAHGLAEWGEQPDARAEDRLLALVEDPRWIEDSRLAACSALAWIGTDKTTKKVLDRVRQLATSQDPKQRFVASCYATTLQARPISGLVSELVELLRPDLDPDVRLTIGRAIGRAGFGPGSEVEHRLLELLTDPVLQLAAAPALVLGGSEEAAARTVALVAAFGPEALDALQKRGSAVPVPWSLEDLERGHLFRWVRNADAVARVKVGGTPQRWARASLRAELDKLQFDAGPHSVTRVVLRHWLLRQARTGVPDQQRDAIATLALMLERGALMALRREQGELGARARKALHELRNPPAEG